MLLFLQNISKTALRIRFEMRNYCNTILLTALVVFTACTKDTSGDYTPEAAIKSFSLGTFNILHNGITPAGKDTMVIDQMANGVIIYNIDNTRGLIYNTDTLPFGSVVKSVKTNINVAGTPYFHIPDSDNVYHNVQWTSNLEIDLTSPIKISVISTDDSYKREYTLLTNIYDADPDSMKWEGLASLPEGITYANAVDCDGTMTVLGLNNESEPCFTRYDGNSGEWTAPAPCIGLDRTVKFQSLSIHNNMFIINDADNILTSADCENWSNANPDTDIEMLLPFRQTGDYGTAWAITADGWIATSTDLEKWLKIQELPSGFPAKNLGGICNRLATNRNILRYIITGTDSENKETLIWTKLSTENIWSQVIPAEDHNLKCPAFNNLATILYDGRLYSFGGAMNNFYESRDNGISWRECKSIIETYNSWNNFMQLPKAYKGIDKPFCFAAGQDNSIWLMSSDSRGVWKGYINRLHK